MKESGVDNLQGNDQLQDSVFTQLQMVLASQSGFQCGMGYMCPSHPMKTLK